MKLTNRTPVDSFWLRAVLDTVTPAGTRGFDAEFVMGERTQGRAHHHGDSTRARPFIRIMFARGQDFPMEMSSHADYLAWQANSFEELVICLTAHECRHIWQRDHLAGIYNEMDADAYAWRFLRAHRAGALKIDGSPPLNSATTADELSEETSCRG